MRNPAPLVTTNTAGIARAKLSVHVARLAQLDRMQEAGEPLTYASRQYLRTLMDGLKQIEADVAHLADTGQLALTAAADLKPVA